MGVDALGPRPRVTAPRSEQERLSGRTALPERRIAERLHRACRPKSTRGRAWRSSRGRQAQVLSQPCESGRHLPAACGPLDDLGCDGYETRAALRLRTVDRCGRAIYTADVNRTLIFPPPLPAKGMPEHVRRAMRAFERVHKMLVAKAAAEQSRTKRRRRTRVA